MFVSSFVPLLKCHHDDIVVVQDKFVVLTNYLRWQLHLTIPHETSKVPACLWNVEEVVPVDGNEDGISGIPCEVEAGDSLDGKILVLWTLDCATHKGHVGIWDTPQLALQDWGQNCRAESNHCVLGSVFKLLQLYPKRIQDTPGIGQLPTAFMSVMLPAEVNFPAKLTDDPVVYCWNLVFPLVIHTLGARPGDLSRNTVSTS